jgi:hypothetical protein
LERLWPEPAISMAKLWQNFGKNKAPPFPSAETGHQSGTAILRQRNSQSRDLEATKEAYDFPRELHVSDALQS